jgi:hypothetical protein
MVKSGAEPVKAAAANSRDFGRKYLIDDLIPRRAAHHRHYPDFAARAGFRIVPIG